VGRRLFFFAFLQPFRDRLCHGTPDPTLRLSESARRPARAGPGSGPAPAGGRAGLLPIRGRLVARAGPGRARALLALGGAGRVGPRPGPARAWWCGPGRAAPGPCSPSGVSTSGGDGCGASRLRDAGLRPYRPHPLGRYAVLSFCACVYAVSSTMRGSLGALLRRALGPSFYSEQWCWPGQSPSRRLRRRPELPGVIKHSHLVAPAFSSSDPT
jgi:hypothetical protein